MDFRTSKCAHNERGMCIHCLVKRGKNSKDQTKIQQQKEIRPHKCTHPTHMKCLKCLPSQTKKSPCMHPDYQQCKNCENYINYQSFEQYLQQLANQCKHKKPCTKCVPPLNRKTYSIDKSCKNHLPYPQAQCDACMAPIITVAKQSYTHVQKVRIMTNSIYKISETKAVGVLLGMETNQGVIEVYDIYFPEDQDFKSGYINPDCLGRFNQIYSYLGLSQVGIIYSSAHLSSMALMVSSVFQQNFSTVKNGYQISKFITMRLQFSDQQNNFEPHFQCFMISDQFLAFHRNGLIFQKNTMDANSFDLITAKQEEKMSIHPAFLRQGTETNQIFFKEMITWIPTVYQQNKQFQLHSEYLYPYFTIQKQSLDHFNILLNIDPRDPLQKYRNIQFLLHLAKLIGIQNVMVFLFDFYLEDPDLFLGQKLKMCQNIQKNKDRNVPLRQGDYEQSLNSSFY